MTNTTVCVQTDLDHTSITLATIISSTMFIDIIINQPNPLDPTITDQTITLV